jgi:hypothetical protein
LNASTQKAADHASLSLSLAAKDVGVTGIEDGHGRAAEELSAGGTQLNLYGEDSCKPKGNRYPPKSIKDFFSGLVGAWDRVPYLSTGNRKFLVKNNG